MCDYSGRLIAWLDKELPEGEATFVERHLQVCLECRSRIVAYQQASRTFDAYCDAEIASEWRPSLPRWIRVTSASAAAAVAVAALFLMFPRGRVARPPIDSPTAHSSQATDPHAGAAHSVVALETPPSAVSRVEQVDRRHAAAPGRRRSAGAAPLQVQDVGALPAESAIEITIPSDAMFPPGAVPEGVSFVAEVILGADGSAERLRLQPQFVTLERRATRP
jgi:anti-sigma factor RsiW